MSVNATYEVDLKYAFLQELAEKSLEELIKFASERKMFKLVSGILSMADRGYIWEFAYLSICQELKRESQNTGI